MSEWFMVPLSKSGSRVYRDVGSNPTLSVFQWSKVMVLTVLEAHLVPDKWPAMEKAYKESTGKLPPPVLQSFLVHGTVDTTLWQIITVWRSRRELEEARRQGTPRGVLIFRSVGAEPKLSIFDIVAEGGKSAA